jgi:hypothetical protein
VSFGICISHKNMPSSRRKNSLTSRYYDTAIHAALSALKRGDKVNAERLALRAASYNPDSEAPWLILASLSSPEESLAYVKKALQINPESIRVQQAMEWVRGRLQTHTGTAESEQPAEEFPLPIDLIETPRRVQPAEVELEQPIEDLYPAADLTETIGEVQPAAVEPEQPAEELAPAIDLTETPRKVQPAEMELEQPLEDLYPAADLTETPSEVQPAAVEPELPHEPLPSRVDRSEAPTEVQPVAAEPEPPAERPSPLGSLPNWIDFAYLPRAVEPVQPLEQHPSTSNLAAEKPAEVQPVAVEPEGPPEKNQPPTSTASPKEIEPVKTLPFVMEPEELRELTAGLNEASPGKQPSFITELERSTAQRRSAVSGSALFKKPRSAKSTSTAGDQNNLSRFLDRFVRYLLFVLTVIALIAALMFTLPQLAALWSHFFPGK